MLGIVPRPRQDDAPAGRARAVPIGEADDDVPDYVSQVLDVVDLIPPGRVMTYGDVAEFVGQGGPRQVGAVMSRWGGAVPWWRVVKADGSPPPGHEREALASYRAEGTPVRPSRGRSLDRRIDLRRARWDGVG